MSGTAEGWEAPKVKVRPEQRWGDGDGWGIRCNGLEAKNVIMQKVFRRWSRARQLHMHLHMYTLVLLYAMSCTMQG
jgi:hypothetical protein